MTTWKEFEIQCTDYLNDKFGEYAGFIHQGGADSTVSDILVKTHSGTSFYIDAKHSPAQCGQFVLFPDPETRTFKYSSLNANPVNRYSEMIISCMNDDFDGFREAGISGKDIDMPNGQDIFASWIIKAYRDKGTKFFITNNYTILPIERLKDHFYVTAKYRIKRSGSSNIGRSRFRAVIDHIRSGDHIVDDIFCAGDKLFVVSPQQLHDQRFVFQGFEYMFSSRGSKYELRRLSNTYNANVIFSISQKPCISGMDDKTFINYLK